MASAADGTIEYGAWGRSIISNLKLCNRCNEPPQVIDL